MTARELFDVATLSGTITRKNLDNFFTLLSDDTLSNQIDMTLTSNDECTLYITIDNKEIKVIE